MEEHLLGGNRVARLSVTLAVLVSILVALPGTASAVGNSAVTLDGVNDAVQLGTGSATNPLRGTQFTLELWFKRTGAGLTTGTGTGGITAVPLIAKGRSEADGTNQDANYFLGIDAN